MVRQCGLHGASTIPICTRVSVASSCQALNTSEHNGFQRTASLALGNGALLYTKPTIPADTRVPHPLTPTPSPEKLL